MTKPSATQQPPHQVEQTETPEIDQSEQSKQSKWQEKRSVCPSIAEIVKDLSKTAISETSSDQIDNLECQVDLTHRINCVMASHMDTANSHLDSMQNALNILLCQFECDSN